MDVKAGPYRRLSAEGFILFIYLFLKCGVGEDS